MGCALLILAAMGSARAQETATRTLNLDAYTKTLAHYGYMSTSFAPENGEHPANVIQLATADPTLARAPRVRLLTINILQKVNAVSMAEKRSAAEYESLRKRHQKSSSTTTRSSSDNYNNNRPPKPDKGMQLMQDQSKISMDLQRLKRETSAGIKAIVAQISALEKTPEGQQFAMPLTSAFLGKIDPFSARVNAATVAGVPLAVAPEFKRFEVVNTTADGFYGYETKLDINTEQNGDQPPGSTKKDAEGNYVHIAETSKSVFVRGYTKPASMGDIVRIKVSRGEKKVVNGVEVREYVVVPE